MAMEAVTMPRDQFRVERRPEHFLSDDRRVIPRFLDLGPSRTRGIFSRVMQVPEEKVPALVDEVMRDFQSRHRDIRGAFEASFADAVRYLRRVPEMSPQRRLLVGAYFTMEYSIESAALFNPSIVCHPDQDDLPAGAVRFLMSLRATGEGHLSSIVFRSGVILPDGDLIVEPPAPHAFTARPVADPRYDKAMIRRKLRDMGEGERVVAALFDRLGDPFTREELEVAVSEAILNSAGGASEEVAIEVLWLADANYTLRFPEDCPAAGIVIFPATDYEQRGMEDLRLTAFVSPDGERCYYGTYTAYDGYRIHPMMVETKDFRTFHISTLSGRYARNKGMALFPRRVGDEFLMLARHDGENQYLLRSKNLYVWNHSQFLHGPVEPWELVQVGNCGPPLETEAGWIVLTHGVGQVREYCIGALLLDLEDPGKVIGRLREPLLVPTAEEREGYVPNVVYTCGSLVHEGELVIPYAMSDSRTAFGTIPVEALVERLLTEGP